MKPEVKDYSQGPLAEGQMYVYYVCSDGTYFGKTKFHASPDCPHLAKWSPAGWRVKRKSGWKNAKLIIKNRYPIGSVDCKTCLRRKT